MSIPAREGLSRPLSELDRLRLGEVLAESFAFPASDVPAWLTTAGHENVRVFHRDGELVAGLLHVPMGQFWGGRSVSVGGYSGVAVAAHARGTGVATRMMIESLRELRGQGMALAALYPATQPIYRKVGFEQAGARFKLEGPLSALPRGSRTLPMRPVTSSDLPAIRALYSETARRRAGHLDRGGYVWNRIQLLRGTPAPGYVVEEHGQLAGYVFVIRARKPSLRQELTLTDWNARSPEAWQRLIAFAADHASIAEDLTWYGSESDPLLLLLDEQRFEATVLDWWMLRILDLEQALTQRGYPALPRAELHLELSDPLFPENSGRFVLEVSGGEGRVTRGGSGALKSDVRTFASLYSGHRAASQLHAVGKLSATPEMLELADALFAGPAPSMPDMF